MSSSVAVPEAAVQQFSKEAELIVSELRAIEVTDQDSYNLAADALARRAGFKKRIVEFFRPMKEQADKLHKTICSNERLILTGPGGVHDLAEQATRTNMSRWWNKKEDERRKEDLRLAAEQKTRDDAARATAAATAEQLWASPEAVQHVLADYSPPPPPKAMPTATAAPGTYHTHPWKWRFEADEQKTLEEIVKAICGVKSIKNKGLLGYLLLNESSLTSDAKTKKNLASVPGVAFYEDTTTVIRGK
jgi:hypothetical protein